MGNQTRMLVPIRYPLTAKSTQTLAAAQQLAVEEYDQVVQVIVLHINVIQYNSHTHDAEIRRAVAPILGEIPFSVTTRQGFLVEETILDEVIGRDVDIVVVGKNTPRWRRVLSYLLGNEPDVATYLEHNTPADTAVTVIE